METGCTTLRCGSSLLALGLISATTWAGAAAATPVDLARQYLARWQQELAAIVAEEHLTQTIWSSAQPEDTVQRIVSDVLVVHSARENAWLMFRDVISVNGEAVRDREQRFEALFAGDNPDVVASARRIADESARYNAGHLFRNVNTPLAPLVFLDPAYSGSTRWTWRDRVLDGRSVVELAFEQHKAPFAIHKTSGKPQPVDGRIWCERATGRIVKAEFRAEDKVFGGEGFTKGLSVTTTTVSAQYGPVRDLGAWVPLRVDERIELRVIQPQLTAERGSLAERLVGTAVYSNYRQFQTGGRLVGPDQRAPASAQCAPVILQGAVIFPVAGEITC